MDFHNYQDENHRLLDEIMNNNNKTPNNNHNNTNHNVIDDSEINTESISNDFLDFKTTIHPFNDIDHSTNIININDFNQLSELTKHPATTLPNINLSNNNSLISHIYPNTPAQQHEQLRKNDMNINRNHSNVMHNNKQNIDLNKKQISVANTPTMDYNGLYLDDMFTGNINSFVEDTNMISANPVRKNSVITDKSQSSTTLTNFNQRSTSLKKNGNNSILSPNSINSPNNVNVTTAANHNYTSINGKLGLISTSHSDSTINSLSQLNRNMSSERNSISSTNNDTSYSNENMTNIINSHIISTPSAQHNRKSSFANSLLNNDTSLEPHSFTEPIPSDFLFNQVADDALLSYIDDFTSSLSSSVTSDILTPSSFSFNRQNFDSSVLNNNHNNPTNNNNLTSSVNTSLANTPVSHSIHNNILSNSNNNNNNNNINNNNNNFNSTNNNNSNNFNNSSVDNNSLSSSFNNNNNMIRSSTPTSIRPGNYLSQSFRQPNMLNTPKSRHASLVNNLETLSTSVPKSLSHLTNEEKLRRKRDFHNAVERRRRELIKGKIKELGNLVPPTLLCFDDNGKKVKPNKGIVLNRTVEYIRFLLNVIDAQEARNNLIDSKINELSEKMKEMNIPFEEDTTKQSPLANHCDMLNNNSNNNKFTESNDINVSCNANSAADINADDNMKDIQLEVESLVKIENDDLNQFLSGDIKEAEDNAKLMFDDAQPGMNAADYLLEFDS